MRMRESAVRTPIPKDADRSSAPEPHSHQGASDLIDRRPLAGAQRDLAQFILASPRVAATAEREARLFGAAAQRVETGRPHPLPHAGDQADYEETESLQLETTSKPSGDETGMPDSLKAGIEALSGMDLSGVRVHANSGQPARFNALAYAQGHRIHLGPGQERHLPHEAWHVVQQAQGRVKPTRQMEGGIPLNDDQGLEREADVMGGKAAAGTAQLKAVPKAKGHRPVRHAPVQCIGTDELKGRGMAIESLAEFAPETGVNLWSATNPRIPATIYLLGTSHGLKLSGMGADAVARRYLIHFLSTGAFTHVYSEMEAHLPATQYIPDLADRLEDKRIAMRNLSGFRDGGPPASDRANYLAYRRALEAVSNADSGLGGNDLPLDDAYLNLAQRPRAGMPAGPQVGALEDDLRRAMAHNSNSRDMGLDPNDSGHRLRLGPAEAISGSEDVVLGNQKALFSAAAAEAQSGRDLASTEQRNKQWMKRVSPDHVKPNDLQLWIIGAAHLAGLVLRFRDIRWEVTHRAPPAANQEAERKAGEE